LGSFEEIPVEATSSWFEKEITIIRARAFTFFDLPERKQRSTKVKVG
jgi:hypothetical protein